MHIPFCFHKCHYCDFYSIVDDDRQAVFADRLIDELRLRADQIRIRPRTVFVGGGTPTLLETALWRQLLDVMAELNLLADVREFTVEANPETVSAELLDVLAAGGVNRVSIGSQSSDPGLLKTLERWHEPANVRRAVQLARQAGIANVNVDHIFAVPGQTPDMLDSDLDFALSLEAEHMSWYGLTYEPNTAMTQRLRQGQFTAVDEDTERRMYQRLLDRLADAGYEHYEISNWAKPGRQCQHNLIYWRNENWLGVGPSAASHIDGHRWKNKPHLGQYLAAQDEPATIDHELLPTVDRVGEQLMMALRLREGARLSMLKEDDKRWAQVNEMIDAGLLQRTATHLRLTPRGLFVADSVMERLL